MDEEENGFPQTADEPHSLKLIEYLIGRIAALEKRIEFLERKASSPAENGNDLLKELISRSDALDKKLDILIGQTAEQNKINEQPAVQSAKKRVAVFIDGENISHKKAKKIIEYANNLGSIELSRVYGVQNNPSDKCWVKASNAVKIKHIRLAGGSKKNKVDKKMFEEILNEAKKKDHADIIAIATNDGDFAPTVQEVQNMGISVVMLGVKSAMSDKIKNVCNSFVYL